jgi:hypothetical protein
MLRVQSVGISVVSRRDCVGVRFAPSCFDGPPSLLDAVEVFDGSSIVDPVVVSNLFWASLKAKLLSVLLGQLLAALICGAIVAFGAAQFAKVNDIISVKLFQDPLDSSSPGFRTLPKQQQSPSVQIRQEDLVRLLVSLLVDIIGTSSEVIPIVGELSDIAWAPVAGFVLRALYGSNVVLVLEVVEEILPFTDFLPLATICWVVDTFFVSSEVARALQIGQYRRAYRSSELDEARNSLINGEMQSRESDFVVDVETKSVEDELKRLKRSINQHRDTGDSPVE